MAKMRLDKFLSNMGIGSRSDVKRYVKEKKIKINNTIAKDASAQINIEKDKVYYLDKEITYRKNIYLMLNKPSGVVSATIDNIHKTVIDLLSDEYLHFELFPVGRLDIDTEGLLLLTNDGVLSHNLLSPKKHIDKTYYAEVNKIVTKEDIKKFAVGIVLDDGYKTMASELKVLDIDVDKNISKVEITIKEGKFHQIKRMVADIGAKVLYLKRVKMGNLLLDENLSLGEYRELTKEELEKLRNYDAL